MTRLMKSSICLLFLCIFFNSSLSPLSSLANNDPYPVFSAIYDPYLSRWEKEWIIGCNEICYDSATWALAISAFDQKARSGRDFAHNKRLLGDLTGPWNMLGMLYGPIPAGFTLQNTQLGAAKLHIFSDLFQSLLSTPGAPVPLSFEDFIISDSSSFLLTDSSQNIGFFSVPIHYRKIGMRFQLDILPFCDFGLTVQGGISEVRQTVTALIDRSQNIGPENQGPNGQFGGNCPPLLCPGQPFENNFFRNIPVLKPDETYSFCDICDPNLCQPATTDIVASFATTATSCTNPFMEIENQLMQASFASKIFREIGYDDCNFERTSFEDLRFILWWRHIYEINRDRCSWPYFLLMPSIEFNFVVPTARKKERQQLYSVPFGNDGHWAIGFDAGISLDFVETVEIAFYGGLNYFFPRNIKHYHIPTDVYQQSIFPFSTEVKVSPGLNFNWRAVFHAYHFLDRLSAFAEYVLVKHETDDIDLCHPDPAFLVKQAECTTKFASQFVNTSLYYDISPNIQLGVLAQFPVAQRNAYRSSTYMGTFRAVF
jgi:hypothetical protein